MRPLLSHFLQRIEDLILDRSDRSATPISGRGALTTGCAPCFFTEASTCLLCLIYFKQRDAVAADAPPQARLWGIDRRAPWT